MKEQLLELLTRLTKYGVEYTLQIPEIRERIVKTNIEK